MRLSQLEGLEGGDYLLPRLAIRRDNGSLGKKTKTRDVRSKSADTEERWQTKNSQKSWVSDFTDIFVNNPVFNSLSLSLSLS